MYQFGKYLIPPLQGHCQGKREEGKSKEEKRDKGQRMKPLTRTQAIDALTGDEEQNGKQKKEK